MIQIITYNTNKYNDFSKDKYKISEFGSFEVFDTFDLVYIDMTDKKLWYNNGNNINRINSIKDLKSIKNEIINTNKSKILINLPLNVTYFYSYSSYEGNYTESIKIKDIITQIRDILTDSLGEFFKYFNIDYSKNKTVVNNKEYMSDFNLKFSPEDSIITKGKSNDRPTTIQVSDNIYITSLNINENYELFDNFINIIFRKQDKESKPTWIDEIKILDDSKLIEEKEENVNKIKSLEVKNIEIDNKLYNNNRIKSILYTTGDELVEVVLDILGDMVGINLKEFEDVKEEDFRFIKDEVTFIGEIKGVSQNIKRDNVSQTDLHVQEYLDSLDDNDSPKVKGILIINHQRNKKISERENPNNKIVSLAIRNECLIIETTTLLNLYEKYKKGELSSNDIINILKNEVGLYKTS